VEENQEKIDEEPPEEPDTVQIKEVFTKEVLSVVNKSQILELTGLTIWEKIVKEIMIFVILLLFLYFIDTNFRTLSPSIYFSTTVTTGLIFLIAGAVNIPLNNMEKSKEERKAWLESIKTQAEEERRKKLKKSN